MTLIYLKHKNTVYMYKYRARIHVHPPNKSDSYDHLIISLWKWGEGEAVIGLDVQRYVASNPAFYVSYSMINK
jgi:hypothetical protein